MTSHPPTKYEGYWKQIHCTAKHSTYDISSLPYPESQHEKHYDSFSFPKPDHFSIFWLESQNHTFLRKFETFLETKCKKVRLSDSIDSVKEQEVNTSCKLCGKIFYTSLKLAFEYKYTPTGLTGLTTPTYISPTLSHYLKVHKIVPSKHLQNLVNEQSYQKTTKSIEDDWVEIENPNILSLPLPSVV